MKTYDFKLAEKIVEKFSKHEDFESASMGMQEDWFWTGETVYEDGQYSESFKNKEIGGIDGSNWATPVIQIDMKNGGTHVFNCYETDGEDVDIMTKIEKMALWGSGVCSSSVNEFRVSLEVKDYTDTL